MKPEVGHAETEVLSRVQDRGGQAGTRVWSLAAQAARDLDVHENVLRKWVKEFGSDLIQTFLAMGRRGLSSR
jgi:transposase-like protein